MKLPVSLSVENSGSDYHMPDLGNHSTQNTMSESRKDAALKSATTPLLDDDPENNSSIKVEQKSKISLWQHIKDEVKCYSRYSCPVIVFNLLIVLILLAYFHVI